MCWLWDVIDISQTRICRPCEEWMAILKKRNSVYGWYFPRKIWIELSDIVFITVFCHSLFYLVLMRGGFQHTEFPLWLRTTKWSGIHSCIIYPIFPSALIQYDFANSPGVNISSKKGYLVSIGIAYVGHTRPESWISFHYVWVYNRNILMVPHQNIYPRSSLATNGYK